MKIKLTILASFLITSINTYCQQIGDGYAPYLTDFTLPLNSGVYGGLYPIGSAPDTSHPWQHLFVIRHGNPNNNHQLQIGSAFATNDRLFFRKIAGELEVMNPTWIELATRGANSFVGDQSINGNVGIGTTNPIGKLDVVKATATNGNDIVANFMRYAGPTGGSSIVRFGYHNTCDFEINSGYSNEGHRLGSYFDLNIANNYTGGEHGGINFATNSSVKMAIRPNGKIGIGTTIPETLLNVNVGSGGSNGIAGIRVGGLSNYSSLEFGIDGDYDGMIRSYGNNLNYYAGHWKTKGATASENHSHNWYTSKVGSSDWSSVKMVLNQEGNLGLGTTSPDEKLTVKGKIHTQEVKVDLLGALVPDYVFANDYKIKSLQEVDEYIKKNNHLPEIPSAQEIEKNGLMLAEMNMNLLKKVEELTLYAIEQNKISSELMKKVEKLEAALKK